MSTYAYYLAYKTKDNCFKHVKISDIAETEQYAAFFDANKNGDPLDDNEFNTFTGVTSGTVGTGTKSNHSIYILQKTIVTPANPPATPTPCTTILIRKIETNNTSELESIIEAGNPVTLMSLQPGVAMAGGGSPSSPKRKSSSAGSTMKNRIKKNKNNYKNKQKSNTRKN
jgi:hypothetical protein